MLQQPMQIGARIRNKLNSWSDRTSRPSSLAASAEELEVCLSLMLGPEYESYLDAATLRSLEDHVRSVRAALVGQVAPFTPHHNGTLTLGRLCYAVCRKVRPRIVVETGVAYGVTSAYILQALHDNGVGRLYSVDLPPLASDAGKYVGCMIPSELRTRWELKVGTAQTILTPLIRNLGEIDLFVHDSLHTYSHMNWEFESVLPLLKNESFLIADDIGSNTAFDEIAQHPRVQSWYAIKQREKTDMCGILRLGPANTPLKP